MGCCSPCHAEHVCVFNFGFWKFWENTILDKWRRWHCSSKTLNSLLHCLELVICTWCMILCTHEPIALFHFRVQNAVVWISDLHIYTNAILVHLLKLIHLISHIISLWSLNLQKSQFTHFNSKIRENFCIILMWMSSILSWFLMIFWMAGC